MSVKTKRVILALFLSVFFIFSTTILAHAYSSILAFGDSLSDNGQYGMYADALSYTNPNDTYGFYRHSNGPVWVEYLAGATHFNVPLLDLAYGGATSGWDNPAASYKIGNPIYDTTRGLQWQVWAYKTYISASISPTTLVTLWAGANDMFQTYAPSTPQAESNRDNGFYTPENAAYNIGLAIQNLILIGGKEFLVPNLTYSPTDPYIVWKQAFNSALSLILWNLIAANPGIHIYAVDLNGLVLTGIDHYDGTWLGHYMPYPTPGGAPEGAPDMGPGTYRYWDGVHPTTEVHLQIAAYAAVATYFDTVQKTYIGYYQRPADPGGLIYWAERLDATGGNLTEIIEAFAYSAEAQALYGTIIDSGNISTVVNGIYNALFGRDAEIEGLNWYVNGFNLGQYTPATIMLNVLYGAQNEDLQSVNNKVIAANLFTWTIDPELDGKDFQVTYAGYGDVIAARNFLSLVTSSSTTVPTQDQTTLYMQIHIADPGDPILNP